MSFSPEHCPISHGYKDDNELALDLGVWQKFTWRQDPSSLYTRNDSTLNGLSYMTAASESALLRQHSTFAGVKSRVVLA